MGSCAGASITMARARFIASLSICQRERRESWKKSWVLEASAILLRPRLSPSARRTFRSPTPPCSHSLPAETASSHRTPSQPTTKLRALKSKRPAPPYATHTKPWLG